MQKETKCGTSFVIVMLSRVFSFTYRSIPVKKPVYFIPEVCDVTLKVVRTTPASGNFHP